MKIKADELRQRMYCIVLYNLSPIQQGIQSAHAIVEYINKNYYTGQYVRWAETDKTIVILNGGSSIKLKEHMDYLRENQIVEFATFVEPDLYNGITAICFLADERIWDRETYPDKLPLNDLVNQVFDLNRLPPSANSLNIPAIYQEFDLEAFKDQIGGEKNFLLKEFLSKFRTA